MTHPDADELWDLVRRGPAVEAARDGRAPEALAHARTCPRCQAELDVYRRLDVAARTGVPEDLPRVPPARVWEAVATSVTAEAGPDRDPDPAPAPDPGTQDRPAAAPGVVPAQRRATPRGELRRRGVLAAAAGLAVGVVLGALGWSVVGDRGDGEGTPQAPVVATADLEPLPPAGTGASGEAVLHRAGDGLRLDIRTSGATPTSSGYEEVWLLDGTGSRAVSLGALHDGTGSFVVPAGVDPQDFPLVDVSEEPVDGDPAHSGSSLLRGALQL